MPARAATVVATPIRAADFPAAFTFDPAGRIFYAERFSGEIRIYNPATQADTLFYDVQNVVGASEQGLLGIALHPKYPAKPFVYGFYTRGGSPVTNRIFRVRNSGGTGVELANLVTMKASTNHNGGVIHFGPDGFLYAVLGDVTSPAFSQDKSIRPGKVLRMNTLGRVPPDNPFGYHTWSYGHRNMFGFAFDPANGNLWLSENGPGCTDEVNRVVKGANYGWGPSQTCANPQPDGTNKDGPSPQFPQAHYTPTIAPTGMAFCPACGLGAAVDGTLLMGAWNDDKIRRLTLDAARTSVISQADLFTNDSGILAVERGPDGKVYFSDPAGIHRLDLQP